jgi:hypothetical protein
MDTAQNIPDPTMAAMPALLTKSKVAGFLYGHRKFLVFLGSMLVLLLNKKLNLNLDDKVLGECAALAIAYMGANVGEHFADAMKVKVLAPLLSGSGVLLARRAPLPPPPTDAVVTKTTP